MLDNSWSLLVLGMAAGTALSLLLANWPLSPHRESTQPPTIASTPAPETAGSVAATPAEVRPAQAEPAFAERSQTSPVDADSAPPAVTVALPSSAPPQEVQPPAPLLAALPAMPPAAEPIGKPAWLRNAVAVPDSGGRPMIAVVIDDLGLNRRNADRVVRLPAPLTLAFMTYAEDLDRQTRAAQTAGHELMVHFPMEPLGGDLDSGPNTLKVGLAADALLERLRWGLARFDGYVGINNHMGSKFTGWEPGMTVVLEELRRRGLLFLDSRTVGNSVGRRVAGDVGVPYAGRDVFLDNESSAEAVRERLAETEAVARRHGFAIAIGHPHDGTIEALADWLPTLTARGFALVPVSAIVRRNLAPAG